MSLLALQLLATAGASANSAFSCLGEFQLCPGTRDCTMADAFCGSCKSGEYLCPSDQKTCVSSASSYVDCPSMKGTHLDWTLAVEERLDFLVNATDLPTQIAQLTNEAPAIPHLGIPFYNYLNDDQHGVGQAPAWATIFPNGVGLGKSLHMG